MRGSYRCKSSECVLRSIEEPGDLFINRNTCKGLGFDPANTLTSIRALQFVFQTLQTFWSVAERLKVCSPPVPHPNKGRSISSVQECCWLSMGLASRFSLCLQRMQSQAQTAHVTPSKWGTGGNWDALDKRIKIKIRTCLTWDWFWLLYHLVRLRFLQLLTCDGFILSWGARKEPTTTVLQLAALADTQGHKACQWRTAAGQPVGIRTWAGHSKR